MRLELFCDPLLLGMRLFEEARKRRRLRRLRGTCAHWLTHDHIDSSELIELVAKSGARVFYDIGANVGTWTLLCRALLPQSTIVAFEPMPEHLDAFRINTQGLRNVHLVPVALGSRDETRRFYPTTLSDASSFLPLTDHGKTTWHIENRTATEFSLTTLDQVVQAGGFPAPEVLKLDVQGFELEVLRGAKRTLHLVQWIICEVCFGEFYDGQASFSSLATFLGQNGFEACAFGETMRSGQMLDAGDVLWRKVNVDSRS